MREHRDCVKCLIVEEEPGDIGITLRIFVGPNGLVRSPQALAQFGQVQDTNCLREGMGLPTLETTQLGTSQGWAEGDSAQGGGS